MTEQMTKEQAPPPPPAEPHPESRQGLLLPIAIPVGTFVIIGLVLFGFSRVLLSVTASAATVLALVVAVAIMVVATIVATRERLSNSTLFAMIGVVGGVAMLSGGIAIVAIGTGEGEGGEAQVVTLAALEGAATTGFDPTTLSVVANEPIELDFKNQDPGIQHNVVIFEEDPVDSPDAAPLFSGELVAGVVDIVYPVPPLPAGSFFFHCEVHPTTMVGTIESSEGGEGGGGPTVTAQALAFDTEEIDLPPGRPSTLTFDNEDAGVLHNISIYVDDSLTENLFQGEQFAGIDTRDYEIPALEPGTYYFHCDVHPTMAGDVVVGAGPDGGGEGGGSPPEATGPPDGPSG